MIEASYQAEIVSLQTEIAQLREHSTVTVTSDIVHPRKRRISCAKIAPVLIDHIA